MQVSYSKNFSGHCPNFTRALWPAMVAHFDSSRVQNSWLSTFLALRSVLWGASQKTYPAPMHPRQFLWYSCPSSAVAYKSFKSTSWALQNEVTAVIARTDFIILLNYNLKSFEYISYFTEYCKSDFMCFIMAYNTCFSRCCLGLSSIGGIAFFSFSFSSLFHRVKKSIEKSLL